VRRPPWEGRRIVLGVAGGVAAYKSVQLARDLTRRGATVEVVLTRGGGRFINPLAFEGVTGRPVYHALEAGWEGEAALHIRLGLEADLVLVAPATADLLARAAQGRADDLLTTLLLVTRAPVLLAPAMNDRMFSHPQTALNLRHCIDVLGYRVVGPEVGPLAAGEGEGQGRMTEPEDICEWIGRILGEGAEAAAEGLGASGVRGRRVLVTAGPTREALDPVRYLGNRSSGRMGYALAREAWLRGGEVTLVTGPTDLPLPLGIRTIRVESAEDMREAVVRELPEAELTLFAAAVADFRPLVKSDTKWKRRKGGAPAPVELIENPDIAGGTVRLRRRGSVTVGFALESEALLEGANRKLEEKGFDLIVANAVGEEGAGFEVETNRVTLLDRRGGREEFPLLTKEEVARRLFDRIGALWTDSDAGDG